VRHHGALRAQRQRARSAVPPVLLRLQHGHERGARGNFLDAQRSARSERSVRESQSEFCAWQGCCRRRSVGGARTGACGCPGPPARRRARVAACVRRCARARSAPTLAPRATRQRLAPWQARRHCSTARLVEAVCDDQRGHAEDGGAGRPGVGDAATEADAREAACGRVGRVRASAASSRCRPASRGGAARTRRRAVLQHRQVLDGPQAGASPDEALRHACSSAAAGLAAAAEARPPRAVGARTGGSCVRPCAERHNRPSLRAPQLAAPQSVAGGSRCACSVALRRRCRRAGGRNAPSGAPRSSAVQNLVQFCMALCRLIPGAGGAATPLGGSGGGCNRRLRAHAAWGCLSVPLLRAPRGNPDATRRSVLLCLPRQPRAAARNVRPGGPQGGGARACCSCAALQLRWRTRNRRRVASARRAQRAPRTPHG
jgi:hypothetical protein